MPQYLRKDSVRLFEASVESLALGLTGIGLPIRRDFREPGCQYAASIGLIGTAAEQAMSAILVQTYGPEVLIKPGHKYKTFREVLDETRSLLKNPVPRASFLTSSIADGKAHREALFEKTTGFLVLCKERAIGLHAGSGPSREVVCIVAQKVYEFLKVLGKSTRIRSYLEGLPVPPSNPPSTNILIDDLVTQLASAKGVQDRSALIRSVFLVLPEIPDLEPDWLEALDRISVVPEDKDLTLLVTTLERAIPVQFQRVSTSNTSPISVVVRPEDPNAIPIAPHQLRRSFTQISDQFAADIGNANGRLELGVLHLPPDDFTIELFVLGHDGIRSIHSRPQLTANEAWPFVATAICAHKTEGPYWFIVRMTDDHSQLLAILHRAMRHSTGTRAKERHDAFRKGIAAIRENRPLASGSTFCKEISEGHSAADKQRRKLMEAVTRNGRGELGLSQDGADIAAKVSSEQMSIGQGMAVILESALTQKGRTYWARLLCEAASEPDDLRAVVGVLNDDNLLPAHTAARKAIRLIDVTTFGPPMELNST